MSAITRLIKLRKNKTVEDLLTGRRPSSYSRVSLQDVVTSPFADERVMMGQLIHIRRQKEVMKKLVIKKMSGYGDSKVGKQEKNYFRIVFFRIYENDEVSVIVLNEDGKDAFSYSRLFHLGGTILISNPKFQGYWKDLIVLDTDCIFPVTYLPNIPSVPIPSAAILVDRYYAFTFAVSDLRVASVKFEVCCNMAGCDGRYKTDCFCIEKKDGNVKLLPGFDFVCDEFRGLTIATYYSNSLAAKLLPVDMLKSIPDTSFNYIKVSRFLKKAINDHAGIFRVTLWTKPIITTEGDVPTFSLGRLSNVEQLGGASLPTYVESVDEFEEVELSSDFGSTFTEDEITTLDVSNISTPSTTTHTATATSTLIPTMITVQPPTLSATTQLPPTTLSVITAAATLPTTTLISASQIGPSTRTSATIVGPTTTTIPVPTLTSSLPATSLASQQLATLLSTITSTPALYELLQQATQFPNQLIATPPSTLPLVNPHPLPLVTPCLATPTSTILPTTQPIFPTSSATLPTPPPTLPTVPSVSSLICVGNILTPPYTPTFTTKPSTSSFISPSSVSLAAPISSPTTSTSSASSGILLPTTAVTSTTSSSVTINIPIGPPSEERKKTTPKK